MKGRFSKCGLALLAAAFAVCGGGGSRAFAIDGATQWSGNGNWYKHIVVSPSPTWKEAKALAESLGGHLATITSDAEWQFILKTFTVATNRTWLGGTDEGTEGTWRWVTGETWSFTKWGSGEPNNGNGGEHFLEAKSGSWNGDWNDERPAPFAISYLLVEWEGNPTPPVPPSPPAAPSGLVATVSYGNPIQLSWTDNSDNEEEFRIERAPVGGPFIAVATLGLQSTGMADIGTVPGAVYTYRVLAANSGGLSDWSNEATVTASTLAPAPLAPTDLIVVALTRDSVEMTWADISVDEVGFEVHRRRPGGDYALVASLPSGSWGYTDTGLSPAIEYEYGVRSINALRASGFCEVAAATLPTLTVTPLRADLKDSPKFGKDSLKVQAFFDFLPASPDGLWDVLAEGITLRAGPVDRPVVMTLPKNLDTWKVKGTKATWKSPKGSTPKYSIQVDMETRLVKATASGLELPEPPVNPMRVSIAVGDDAGTAKGDWEATKAGVFQLR